MRNAKEEMSAAETALAETEARIAQLEADRIARLEADADYVLTSAQLTRELEKLRETAEAHRARIAVLQAKETKAERERRERQRVTAIAAIKKRLAARVDSARKLARAVEAVAKAVKEFEETDRAVFHGWPAVLPPPHVLRYTSTLNTDALATAHNAPPYGRGVLRALTDKHHLWAFEAEAEELNGKLVADLEQTPLVEREEAAA
jgi:hypothetical protein